MHDLMACPTKCDQVGLRIVTKGAAPWYVVNIEILGASTLTREIVGSWPANTGVMATGGSQRCCGIEAGMWVKTEYSEFGDGKR